MGIGIQLGEQPRLLCRDVIGKRLDQIDFFPTGEAERLIQAKASESINLNVAIYSFEQSSAPLIFLRFYLICS